MKRNFSLIICLVMVLTVLPVSAAFLDKPVYQDREGETLLLNIKFDDEAAERPLFPSHGGSIEIEWVTGIGHDDNSSLKVQHIGPSYNSAENALRLELPEPLQPGAEYRIQAWIYAPSKGNEDKGNMFAGGVVFNGDYGGAFGETKFPIRANTGFLIKDGWFDMNLVIPVQTYAIDFIDFRLVTNNEDNCHADLFYWDNIEIWQIGERDESIRIPKWDMTLPSLAEAYKEFFLIGNVMDTSNQWMTMHSAAFLTQYNLLTAENAMKPLYIARNKGEFTFDGADAVVKWAQENNIAIHGHTLVWHEQSPTWLTMDEGRTLLTRAEAKANLELFITEYAGRYAGKIASWDVVNEAFADSVSVGTPWQSALRTTAAIAKWYQAYENGMDEAAGEAGYDYIYDAFVFTRLAAPDAVLFYNDFNEESRGKCEAIASMAEYFNEKWEDDPRNSEPGRLLIEGIGMQAHYWTGWLEPSSVRESIERFIEAGLRIRITELDIPLGTWSSQRNANSPPATDAELAFQASLYADLFRIFLRYHEHIDAVTIWGLADPLNWRALGLPVLFDGYFEAKPAFWAILEVAENAEASIPTPLPPDEPTNTPGAPDPSAPQDPAQQGPDDDDGASFPWWGFALIGFGFLILVVFLLMTVKMIQKNKKNDKNEE